MDMGNIFEDPRVTAACISAIIAGLGVLASLATSRRQLRLKEKEIDQKALQFEKDLTIKIEAEIEALRQAQMAEILKKRIETYPDLWRIVLRYHRHWRMQRKLFDAKWAQEFLDSINTFNESCGIFFSQDAYASFAQLRDLLVSIEYKFSRDELVPESDFSDLGNIIIGTNGRPGLGTYLKDDLGSYRNVALQKRSGELANQKMHADRWRGQWFSA